MPWLRNISLVSQVTYGFAGLTAVVAAQGGTTLWALRSPASGSLAAMLQVVRTADGIALALGALWLTRSSTKDSVESPVETVVRIASGDLQTTIESAPLE